MYNTLQQLGIYRQETKTTCVNKEMHSWASFQINSRPKKILHLMMIKKVDYYKCLLFMYSYVY